MLYLHFQNNWSKLCYLVFSPSLCVFCSSKIRYQQTLPQLPSQQRTQWTKAMESPTDTWGPKHSGPWRHCVGSSPWPCLDLGCRETSSPNHPFSFTSWITGSCRSTMTRSFFFGVTHAGYKSLGRGRQKIVVG